MRHTRTSTLLAVVALLLANSTGLAAAPAPAEKHNDIAAFLEKLQERGYGELMLDYLDYLKRGNRLPEEVAANWDLYQARGWRMAIGEAFNEKETEERTAKAQEYLDKYLKDHADSAAVGEEVGEWGNIYFKRGLRLLGQSQFYQDKDKEKSDARLSEARAAFDEARPRLKQAIDFYAKRLADLRVAAAGVEEKKPKGRGAAGRQQQKIEDAELVWSDAELKLAKNDFFSAQTYAGDQTEAGQKVRKDLLEKARAQFNAIYTRHRAIVIGLYAHTFEGKCCEEVGDDDLAKEMYDEVLIQMPDNGKEKVDRAQQTMFAQVEYFYLTIFLKLNGKKEESKREDGEKEFLSLAREWLRDFDKWKTTEGYQGIAVEVAKLDLAKLEKASLDQKAKLRHEAEGLLKEAKKHPGEHHQEVMHLLKSLSKRSGTGAEPKTSEEAIANGDDAFAAQKWDLALENYRQALALSKSLPDKQRKEIRASAHEKLDTCHYNTVYQLFSAGNEDEAAAKIASLIEAKQINPKSETAGKLAALRVHIILRRYGAAQDSDEKAKLLEELTAAAAAVIEAWPDKPAADDARIALAQASMVQGKTAEAVEQLENVNPRSERFAGALYMAAQGHLRIWTGEKQKPPAERKAQVLKMEADKAIEDLEKSVELQTKALGDGEAPPAQLIESQLVLGQVYLEAGEPKKSADLLQPIVDAIKAAKPQKLEPVMLKVFNTAVRAAVATGDMKKGDEIATLLTELGEDTAEVNGVLVVFAGMLRDEYKQANAAEIEAKNENDLPSRQAAEARMAGTRQLLGKLLEKLSPREHNTPVSMIQIGDMATLVGLDDLARDIYNRILKQAQADDAFRAQCGKNGNGLIRVRAQLVDLLRQKGEFEQGLKQVDALIDEVPNAIEPQMTKGRILQAWAEKAPQKLPDAVSHWAGLRFKLEKAAHQPKAPRDLVACYYEVAYNVALCLLEEAQTSHAAGKAVDAQKVLNALLLSAPKLDGPETVAKYRDLIKRSDEFTKKGQKAQATPAATLQ